MIVTGIDPGETVGWAQLEVELCAQCGGAYREHDCEPLVCDACSGIGVKACLAKTTAPLGTWSAEASLSALEAHIRGLVNRVPPMGGDGGLTYTAGTVP